MCTASNRLNLLLITAILTFIMCSRGLNGHPLKPNDHHYHHRQLSPYDSDDPQDDILAGAEFLSLFMQSARLREYMTTTTTTTTTDLPATTTTILGENNQDNNLLDDVSNFIRTSRAIADDTESSTIIMDNLTSDYNPAQNHNDNDDEYQVLKVRVSTSISSNHQRKRHNRNFDSIHFDSFQNQNQNQQFLVQNGQNNFDNEKRTFLGHAHTQHTPAHDKLSSTQNQPSTAHDQEIMASDPQPEAIISAVQKSEFPVEESDPITRNKADLLPSEFTRPFNLPNFETKPYQTVIYHDNQQGNDANRARSVSYSTVIRQVAKNEPKISPSSTAESNFYVVTTKPDNIVNIVNNVNNKTDNYPEEMTSSVESTTRATWKPKIYGEPEKNYEIDEAISVKTNGRAHGVITTNANDQNRRKSNNKEEATDDNQKVGYVVEGRNFRKYRVEERTPDGFIVGEYGVVSHDDGSLRGVRYTADGTINPRLIYDALMKFLSL